MSRQAEAIVFPEPNRVEIWTVEIPAPRADEVAVRTIFSGVSQGTERWMLLGRYNRMGEDVARYYP